MRSISDFPDKLNPMLVKELRQGLRGISFMILFITVQAFLCFILLITTAIASGDNAGHLLSRTIFFFFALAVIVIQPLRGISALHGEIKGNTIDLLCLTRLSAWRITYGKWISIVSQSALILTAIAPYLILRYFFGDMRMFSEILLLLCVFLISAMLTALTIGLSAMSSAIIRVLLPIAGSVFLFFFVWGAFVSAGRVGFQFLISLVTLNSAATTFTFLGFIIAALYTTWMCLDIGTSLIAPISENRATFRRSISLALITSALLVFGLVKLNADLTVAITLVLCIPIAILSLTENANLVQPIVNPFASKGMLGKIPGRILYPGWATGLLFILLLYAVVHAIMSWLILPTSPVPNNLLTVINTTFAALLFPLALTRLFARKSANRFSLFILFTCTQFLIVLIVVAAESWVGSSKLNLMPYFCWIPASSIYLLNDARSANHGFGEVALLYISYLNVLLYALIPLLTTFPVWKHIRKTEQSAISNQ